MSKTRHQDHGFADLQIFESIIFEDATFRTEVPATVHSQMCWWIWRLFSAINLQWVDSVRIIGSSLRLQRYSLEKFQPVVWYSACKVPSYVHQHGRQQGDVQHSWYADGDDHPDGGSDPSTTAIIHKRLLLPSTQTHFAADISARSRSTAIQHWISVTASRFWQRITHPTLPPAKQIRPMMEQHQCRLHTFCTERRNGVNSVQDTLRGLGHCIRVGR